MLFIYLFIMYVVICLFLCSYIILPDAYSLPQFEFLIYCRETTLVSVSQNHQFFIALQPAKLQI